ncbi:hypothetical protein FBU59_003645, partial [Linderina macrospora]
MNMGSKIGFGEAPATPRHRRPLVDMIQNDFPRTPSPAIDASGSRIRLPNGSGAPISASTPTAGGASSAELTSSTQTPVSIVGAGQQQQPVPGSSAFSSLTAPGTRTGFSPSSLLSDSSRLGVPMRQPSVAPPSRSHSVAIDNPSDVSHATGQTSADMMVNSLLDQEEGSSGRRGSQLDSFSLRPSGGWSLVPPGQQLWASHHAARLDGMQRAASTPPRNALGNAPNGNIWGPTNDSHSIGSGSLLRDNALLSRSPAAPSSNPLSFGDDLSYGMANMRLGDGGGADQRGSFDLYGDLEAPAARPLTASSHVTPMGSGTPDQWGDLAQQRMYDNGSMPPPQTRRQSQTPGVTSAPFVDAIITDRNALYANPGLGQGVQSAGILPSQHPGFARAQTYNDGRFMRAGGPTSAYPLPQPVAQRPTIAGMPGANVPN